MRSGPLLPAALLAAAQVQGLALHRRDTEVTFRVEQQESPGDPPIISVPSAGVGCPPFSKSSFDITAYQLYPENMDWDARLCHLYVGILFNASFGVYNPYTDQLSVIEFPKLTHVKEYHVGAVAWDRYSNHASVIIGQGNAFETSGATISGDNILKKYNPVTGKFLWTLNITALTQGKYGGFQDITHDSAGNTYLVGTFPSSIVRANANGTALTPWYLPETVNHTIRGYSGIASHGNTILALDSLTGTFFRFDAALERGIPVPVPHTPAEPILRGDAIKLPLKYNGTVLLVAQHLRGIAVLRSRDGSWKEAEYLGVVPNKEGLDAGALTVSVTEIGGKIFTVTVWFADQIVEGTVAGAKRRFPMVDITGEVDKLLDRK